MSKFRRNKNGLLKEKCLTYLGGKVCSRCGVNSLPICCYDFHHSKGTKEELISKMIARGAPWSKLKAELDKCEVACANCHRTITAYGSV